MNYHNAALIVLKNLVIINVLVISVLGVVAVGQFTQALKMQHQYMNFQMEQWALGSPVKKNTVETYIKECLDANSERDIILRSCADRVGAKELLAMLDDKLVPNAAWPLSIVINK